MSLLAFRRVSKRFADGVREVAVLDRVSFEVYPGEKVGVLASRRAGKTTLLRVAAGLLAPDEGEVVWDGSVDLAGGDANLCARVRRRGGVALVRGDWRSADATPVLQHVGIPLYSAGVRIEEAERGARRALEWVGASQLGYRDTGQLALWDRLVVELARAVVREPRLLLIDEPAVLPQPREARAFYGLLHDLSDRLGCALLIASEEVSALRGLHPVMSLSDGRLHGTSSRRAVIDFPGGGRHSGQRAS
jgi:ABC-type methionine transport system ATPase subunit